MNLKMAPLINQVDTNEKAIAFTFDDGPNPVYTPQVLDIFAAVGGKATFFMIGKQMEEQPELVRTVHRLGHEIGNHTYTHPNLPEITPDQREEELSRTDRVIQALIGEAPKTFRPPYIGYNDEVSELVARFGYSCAGCMPNDARDWEMPGADHIIAENRPVMQSGSILLFHDGWGDRSHTIEAVRVLTAEAVAAGYRLVTVSELLAMKRK